MAHCERKQPCSYVCWREQLIEFRTLCFQHQEDIKEVLTPSSKAKNKGMLQVPLYRTYSEKMKMRTEDGVAAFAVEVVAGMAAIGDIYPTAAGIGNAKKFSE